jgi:hypothetical protein
MTKSFYKCGVARKYSKSNTQSAKAVTFAGGKLRPGREFASGVCGSGGGPRRARKKRFCVRENDRLGRRVGLGMKVYTPISQMLTQMDT